MWRTAAGAAYRSENRAGPRPGSAGGMLGDVMDDDTLPGITYEGRPTARDAAPAAGTRTPDDDREGRDRAHHNGSPGDGRSIHRSMRRARKSRGYGARSGEERPVLSRVIERLACRNGARSSMVGCRTPRLFRALLLPGDCAAVGQFGWSGNHLDDIVCHRLQYCSDDATNISTKKPTPIAPGEWARRNPTRRRSPL